MLVDKTFVLDLSAGLTCFLILDFQSVIYGRGANAGHREHVRLSGGTFVAGLYLCTNPQPLSAHYGGGQKSEPLARLKGCANFSLLRQVMQREMLQVAC